MLEELNVILTVCLILYCLDRLSSTAEANVGLPLCTYENPIHVHTLDLHQAKLKPNQGFLELKLYNTLADRRNINADYRMLEVFKNQYKHILLTFEIIMDVNLAMTKNDSVRSGRFLLLNESKTLKLRSFFAFKVSTKITFCLMLSQCSEINATGVNTGSHSVQHRPVSKSYQIYC